MKEFKTEDGKVLYEKVPKKEVIAKLDALEAEIKQWVKTVKNGCISTEDEVIEMLQDIDSEVRATEELVRKM